MVKRASRRSTKRSGRKSRRSHRKSRRNSRRNSRLMYGGWQNLSPAALDDASMNGPGAQSLEQGADYERLHMGQHGGGGPLIGAPLDETGLLDPTLREAARVQPLDASYDAIKGMSDMTGGGRRRRRGTKRRGKGKKRSGKGTKRSRRGRKGTKRSGRGSRRQMRGGAFVYSPAAADAPGTLLPPDLESKAVAALNPEWKLAEDPTSFAPKA